MNPSHLEKIKSIIENPKCGENYIGAIKFIELLKSTNIEECTWKHTNTDNTYTLYYSPSIKLYFIFDSVGNTIFDFFQGEEILCDFKMYEDFEKFLLGKDIDLSNPLI